GPSGNQTHETERERPNSRLPSSQTDRSPSGKLSHAAIPRMLHNPIAGLTRRIKRHFSPDRLWRLDSCLVQEAANRPRVARVISETQIRSVGEDLAGCRIDPSNMQVELRGRPIVADRYTDWPPLQVGIEDMTAHDTLREIASEVPAGVRRPD